jgi:hypothetical protein
MALPMKLRLDELAADLEKHEQRAVPGARLFARDMAMRFVRAGGEVLRQDRGRRPLFGSAEAHIEAIDALLLRIGALKDRLLELDEAEFAERRAAMRAGTYRPPDFWRELALLAHYDWDPFVQKLFDIDEPPAPEHEVTEDMVRYHPSMLKVLLAMFASLRPEDVLYDLGSGLGKVVLLAGWLTEARVRGVEIDPAYHRFALERVRGLGLSRVELHNADVRALDYADGTVFYFYVPFVGETMGAIIAKLARVAADHPITLWSLGRSTERFAAEPWLERTSGTGPNLGTFRSRPL